MTRLDRWLQRYRARVAQHWIPAGARLLDIGCHQGEFLDRMAPMLSIGVGVDPKATPRRAGNIRILRSSFPIANMNTRFDVITILAVLEHLTDPEAIATACRKLLDPGGRLIVTVPAPAVDKILALLLKLRLIDGMSLDEHHGYHPKSTVPTFKRCRLRCVHASRFQCGLNHLFVFEHAGRIIERAVVARAERDIAPSRRLVSSMRGASVATQDGDFS